MEVHAGQIHAGTLEHAAGTFLCIRVLDEDVDLFDRSELPHDLGIDPRDRLEASGPIAGVVRPGDPGCGVRLPLGRHAVAQRRGVAFSVT